MKNADKLEQCIEKAASVVTLLSPDDTSDIEGLGKIFSEISEAIEQATDMPSQLLESAAQAASGAAVELEKMLSQEIQDTNSSIELVSQAVCSLQKLIDQIVKNEDQQLDTNQSDNQLSDSSEQAQEQSVAEDKSSPDQASTQELIIPEEDASLVLDFIAEANEHIEASEAGLLELESKPDDEEVLNLIFRAFHTIKGMAGFLNLTEIGSLAHAAENLLDMARKGELVLVGKNTDVIFESIDMIKKMIAELKESVELGKAVTSQQGLSALLSKLKAAAEGKEVTDSDEPASQRKRDENVEEILEQKDTPRTIVSTTQAKSHTSDEKIKVSTSRLDNLVNMSGELVIAQLMVSEEINKSHHGNHELGRKVAHQSKIIRELQELSMSMRMVPINGVFQKMARVVRDVSRKAGKEINFALSGEETELDRIVVDRIADPLVHMIRNSVDHGIEPPHLRKEIGKDPVGLVQLRAFHQAGNIVIEIQDDGKGLDKESILKKAIDNGIVESGQDMSEEEIFKLIFHAGLSTAKEVTSISGRGVGMDVVKKNIEALRGKIDISSELGRGTTFTIRLPLTLAIIDGQVVKIGSDRYIIPINSIIRSLKPKAQQISTIQGRGEMVMVRGKLLPLVRLYRLFGAKPLTEDLTESLLVIVEEDNKKCCLLVDQLLGQQQVVIKNLGDGLGKVDGVSGGAIMGDGRVSLILDIPGLIQLSQR